MQYMLPAVLKMIGTNSPKLFNPVYFEERECQYLGATIRTVKPILQFTEGQVELRYNIGTRGNGVDQARWPKDLNTEVVGRDPM